MDYILSKKKNVHCLFEQSGIFKNTIKNFGHNAWDYDILNDYDETDFNVDLFCEIDKEINEKRSIFSDMGKNDVILAFFPYTYFSDQPQLLLSGSAYQMQNCTLEQKLRYSSANILNLSIFYQKLCNLIIICIKRKIPLIIENPYEKQNFLGKYFPLRPGLIIKDRSIFGDFYKNPTQFFFINCELEFSFFWTNSTSAFSSAIEIISNSKERSEISSDFAKWFVENVMKYLYQIDDNKIKKECI